MKRLLNFACTGLFIVLLSACSNSVDFDGVENKEVSTKSTHQLQEPGEDHGGTSWEIQSDGSYKYQYAKGGHLVGTIDFTVKADLRIEDSSCSVANISVVPTNGVLDNDFMGISVISSSLEKNGNYVRLEYTLQALYAGGPITQLAQLFTYTETYFCDILVR